MDLIIQSVGILALVCSVISFQQKNRFHILIWQMTASLISCAYLFLLGAYVGACLDIISSVRTLVFSKGGPVLRIPLSVWRFIFIFIMTFAGILTWENAFSLLAILGSCLSTLALSMKNQRNIRIVSLFVGPCWIVYNLIYRAYASIVMEVVAMISIVVGILRFNKEEKRL